MNTAWCTKKTVGFESHTMDAFKILSNSIIVFIKSLVCYYSVIDYLKLKKKIVLVYSLVFWILKKKLARVKIIRRQN